MKFRGITAWHNVGALNQVPFGATFSNPTLTIPTRFRREGDVVRLDGRAISSQNEFWSDMSPRVVFTLPVGFRPTHPVHVPVAGQSSAAVGYLHVDTDGTLEIWGPTQSGHVNLAGVTFTIN